MEKTANQSVFVLDFIKRHEYTVISTVNQDNMPQSAVIGFGETDDLELIFGTSNTSRKYRNLHNNNHVSLVIGWDESETVQYEGTAREVTGLEEERCKRIYYTKNSGARKYENLPDERHFVITPTWIRYTDLGQEPWRIIELQLP